MSKRTNPGSYQELRMWAEAFTDSQEARIAFENKERSGQVPMEAFGPVVDMYREAEARLRKEMIACYDVTVSDGIRQWQEGTPGIGKSTLARLLGVTGDPRTAYPKHWEGTGSERHLVEGEPFERSVGQLWQYCGHGAVKNREVKGDAAALMHNGRPDAKKLVWMMAGSQVKTTAKGGSGYRWVYDAAKAKYAEKVHSKDCTGGYSGPLYVKCKTRAPETEGGKPGYALAGDPYQPSHVHAIALRLTGKRILLDLWLAAGDPETDRKNHEERQRQYAERGAPEASSRNLMRPTTEGDWIAAG